MQQLWRTPATLDEREITEEKPKNGTLSQTLKSHVNKPPVYDDASILQNKDKVGGLSKQVRKCLVLVRTEILM